MAQINSYKGDVHYSKLRKNVRDNVWKHNDSNYNSVQVLKEEFSEAVG